MSDQSIISRRAALIAATTIGAAVAVADASEKDPSGSSKPGDAQFKLSITLTDGQVVTFNAREAVIDFGASGKLLVRPTGVMPTSFARLQQPRDSGDDPFEMPPRNSSKE